MTTLLLLLLGLSTPAPTAPPAGANLTVSIHPEKDALVIDETFRVVFRVRNDGPADAKGVHVKLGANTLTFIHTLAAPPGWTCEQGPLFGYVLACQTPSLASGSEAEFTMNLAAPQHSAMTYRIGASVQAVTDDPAPGNNSMEKGIGLKSTDANAELALTAQAEANQVRIDVRNHGPHGARGVMVVLNEARGLTLAASGKGWKCDAPGPRLICARPELRPGATSGLTVKSSAPPSGDKVTISARVRADQIRENVTRDNAATVTLQ